MAKPRVIDKDLFDNCSSINSNKPGAYIVEEAELNYGGIKQGISIYLREIHIHEDLNLPGITGWIEMQDTDNLISGYISGDVPAGSKYKTIVGQELLSLKFRNLGSNYPVDFTKHPLQIHKIENLQEKESATDAKSVLTYTYRLHFCSPELFTNDRVRVSQAYEDTYSNIVKDILINHLKTRKKFIIQPTNGVHKIVIPNMHPLDAINMIMKECKTVDNMPNYNFYETTNGYRFRSLTGNPSDKTSDYQLPITFGPTIQDSGNYQKDMRTAIAYSFIKLGDTLTNIKTGMFGSATLKYDAFNKVIFRDEVGYHDNLPVNKKDSTYKHFLTEGIVYDATSDANIGTVSEFPDGRLFVTSTNTRKRHDEVDADGKITTGSIVVANSEQKMLRLMQKNHDEYMKMGLTLNGMSGLQVGDKLKLDTMTIGAAFTKGEGKKDVKFSDYYYITQLKHKIDLRSDVAKYTCDIICAQESLLTSKLPSNGDLKGTEKLTDTVWSATATITSEEKDESTHPDITT